MRKTVIAVRGQPNSGKTTMITAAHHELAKAGTSIYSNPRYDATELKDVLEIDGVIVGFASSGDMPDRLERTLRFLLDRRCVVIVCAARLNRSGEPVHKTIDTVEQFSEKNGYELDWIEKPRHWNNRTREDSRAAAQIVARVRRAINALALVGSPG